MRDFMKWDTVQSVVVKEYLCSTCSGNRCSLLVVATLPAVEKTCSLNAWVAGIDKYLCAAIAAAGDGDVAAPFVTGRRCVKTRGVAKNKKKG